MTEADRLMEILTSDVEDLPVFEEGNGNGRRKVPALGPPSWLENSNWQDDPASGKLEKIRSVFLNAKTPEEVYTAASVMPIGDWMEMVAKLGKQVDPGQVQITSIRIELPPIGYSRGEVIEIEVP